MRVLSVCSVTYNRDLLGKTVCNLFRIRRGAFSVTWDRILDLDKKKMQNERLHIVVS